MAGVHNVQTYEVGIITNFTKGTKKIIGFVMYFLRDFSKKHFTNVIKSWHIQQLSYKRQYYNTTQTVRQVCHLMLAGLPTFTLIYITLPPALILSKYIVLYFVKIYLLKTGLWGW
jgi:hypothetical protein